MKHMIQFLSHIHTKKESCNTHNSLKKLHKRKENIHYENMIIKKHHHPTHLSKSIITQSNQYLQYKKTLIEKILYESLIFLFHRR